jgi:hypothetical protein
MNAQKKAEPFVHLQLHFSSQSYLSKARHARLLVQAINGYAWADLHRMLDVKEGLFVSGVDDSVVFVRSGAEEGIAGSDIASTRPRS